MNHWAYDLSKNDNIRSNPSLVDRKVLASVTILDWQHSLCVECMTFMFCTLKMLHDYH